MTDDWTLALIASNAANQAHSRAPDTLLEAVVARRFCVEFHPVLGENQTLMAWRAKARFSDAQGKPLPSRAVLAALHAYPPLLLATELQLKSLALAHAPTTGELLLPLDADSYAAAGACHTANAFDHLLSTHSRVIVEICENQPMVDVSRLQRLLHRLATNGISLAIRQQPPVAACLGNLMQDADWLRIPCPDDLRDARHVRALEKIAEIADQNGGQAFVSNVPDTASLAIIRAIGFSAACGPVFASQIQVSPEARPLETTERRSLFPAWSSRQSIVRRVNAS